MAKADPVVTCIANLLIPRKREGALAKLVKLEALTEDGARALGETLDHRRYAHRGMGARIMPAKIIIDDYVLSHRASPVSLTKALDQIGRWDRDAAEHLGQPLFEGGFLAGKTVLDFGSGRRNTLSIAILLYANGAERVYALEPDVLDGAVAVSSARELVAAMMFDPGAFTLGGTGEAELKRRAASLNLAAAADLTADEQPEIADLGGVVYVRSLDSVPPGSVDMVLSCSVLEHVEGLDREVERLNRVCAPGALAVHTVDFTNHDKTAKDYDPFAIYYGPPTGLNELRPCDIRAIFEGAGYAVAETGKADADSGAVKRDRLEERFRRYDIGDLTRMRSTFVAQRGQ